MVTRSVDQNQISLEESVRFDLDLLNLNLCFIKDLSCPVLFSYIAWRGILNAFKVLTQHGKNKLFDLMVSPFDLCGGKSRYNVSIDKVGPRQSSADFLPYPFHAYLAGFHK